MILSALFAVSIALEVFLFIGNDYVLNTRRRVALEGSLRQAYTDLREAKTRIERRRADLIAAIDDADGQASDLREAAKAFETARRVLPTLIHTVGQIEAGLQFRAPMSKQLPAITEPAQKLL
jgi:hypothetical protein